MCGILFCAHRRGQDTPELQSLLEDLKVANSSRGPDAQDTFRCNTTGAQGEKFTVLLFGSELRLRGDEPVVQPHRDSDSGDVFCWNGEVFDGLNIGPSENDGAKLFMALKDMQDPSLELPGILSSIEGPYALCYFHNATKRIYFGRDPLGRRSLLLSLPTADKPHVILTSVSSGSNLLCDFQEVDTTSLHCIDLLDFRSGNIELSIHPIPRGKGQFTSPIKVNTSLPEPDLPISIQSFDSIPNSLLEAVDGLFAELSRSVEQQVCDIPFHGQKGEARVAVLFSGGIDSTTLAYLADKHLPPDEPIDLLNVAFENPRKNQAREDGGKRVNGKNRARKTSAMDDGKPKAEGRVESFKVPDRLTGLEEVEELRRLSPSRRWNFVEVNVPYEEMTKHRPLVEEIMYPCRTVMDLSLALALYFASRGIGQVRDTPNAPPRPYTSTARVLLNGLGSDELLGGYGRHRTAYASGGWAALISELQLDIDRLPTRNLGRDDRIVSSHGKESRHPFLSLSVLSFLAALPVHHKLDPRLPIGLGLGDKTLLRLLANRCGLREAARRKKRAMQFGTHSARMEAGEAERKGQFVLQSQSAIVRSMD